MELIQKREIIEAERDSFLPPFKKENRMDQEMQMEKMVFEKSGKKYVNKKNKSLDI